MQKERLNMEIFGLGIVALCYLAGNVIGQWIGVLTGIGGNIGGVGIGMFILVITMGLIGKRDGVPPQTEQGVKFLAAIYIPVIVAMAAKTNVVSAVKGGWLAFLAGAVATIASILFVPLISKLGSKGLENKQDGDAA